jgi:hypothetical protein
MKLTLKEDININSLTLQHNILLQATMLLEGREGVLETEKKLYLMIAMVDALIQEDLLTLCNEDSRDLPAIMMEDIEPFFVQLLSQDEEKKKVYDYMTKVLLDRCKNIWDNQHSAMGVIDNILTMIASMSEEDKQEVLKETGKIAETVYEKRTEVLAAKADETNSKLEALVQQYQRKTQEENDTI